MKRFGLIGYPLSHSFSKRYFTEKFANEQLTDHVYELFPIPSIEELPALIGVHPGLQGLNVTIPYKEQVIPFLTDLDAGAKAVGAVNVIKITPQGWIGYNSDVDGFMGSLGDFILNHGSHLYRVVEDNEEEEEEIEFGVKGALVLGTGGAAKAVVYTLKQWGIPFLWVSRTPKEGEISYSDVDEAMLENYPLIINTTPLGMSPNTDSCPPIPYELLTPQNLLFDLVYNPEETLFMQKGAERGCPTKNGLEMLYLQAETAWEIWNQ